MKKIIFFSSILILFFAVDLYAQFNGKPQYDVLVRQYPDTFGTFRMELYPTVAPLHCLNFDTLAQQGFYDSLAFHRVVPGFVVQGGDPNSKYLPPSTWGSGAAWQGTVPAEFNPISHSRSIIGAARGSDINSATSQFYINVANNPGLDNNYTAYGKVISGMNIVDSIENVPTNSSDLPLEKVDMFITYVGMDTSSPSQAPSLVSPADGTQDVTNSESFSWTSVNTNDFILYRIQFSQQSDFSTIDYQQDVRTNVTSLSPVGNLSQGFVTYYWRVLTNNGGRLASSDIRSFTTFIDAPLLQAPADMETGVYKNAWFLWDSVHGANEYRIRVSTIPVITAPNTLVIDTIVPNNYFQAGSLPGNKDLYWGVNCIVNGVEGEYSEIWQFRSGIGTTSIFSSPEQLISMYPNPSSEKIIFNSNSDLNIKSIRFFDLNSRLINEKLFNSQIATVNIRSMNIGMYIVEIETEEGIARKRLIKN